MRRVLLGVAAAAFLFCASAMDVSAAGAHHGEHRTKTYCGNAGRCAVTCCDSYADADRDGCCDNCGAECKTYKNRSAECKKSKNRNAEYGKSKNRSVECENYKNRNVKCGKSKNRGTGRGNNCGRRCHR